MKSSGKYDRWEEGESLWFTLQWNVLCIIDWNHEGSVVVLDHFKNFKDI